MSDNILNYSLADFHYNDNPDVWNEMYDKYLRLADESQARLVQNRAHMTQPEMDADPFYKQYPVPPEDMIIKGRPGTDILDPRGDF